MREIFSIMTFDLSRGAELHRRPPCSSVQAASHIYLVRMSSSETREVRTVNKDMEKMNEIGKKRRKCKKYI